VSTPQPPNEDVRRTAVRLRCEQLSYAKIGDKLGVTKQWAEQLVKTAVRDQKIHWDDVPLGRLTDARIAKLLGEEERVIRKIRAEKGIPAAPPELPKRAIQPLGWGIRGYGHVPWEEYATEILSPNITPSDAAVIELLRDPKVSAVHWCVEAIETRVEEIDRGIEPDFDIDELVLQQNENRSLTVQLPVRPATKDAVIRLAGDETESRFCWEAILLRIARERAKGTPERKKPTTQEETKRIRIMIATSTRDAILELCGNTPPPEWCAAAVEQRFRLGDRLFVLPEGETRPHAATWFVPISRYAAIEKAAGNTSVSTWGFEAILMRIHAERRQAKSLRSR
jgi:hypothetical protein